MKIHHKASNLLLKKGIYCIKNLKTNKVYIGSAKRTFLVRLNSHINDLNKNKHFNSHLQNSWNIYNSNDFEFRILMIIENNIYYWEKRAIQLTNALNNKFGYNINSEINKPPIPTSESRKKQGITIKETNIISNKYLKLFKENKIEYEEIPIKYRGLTTKSIKLKKIMNGKKYENTDHFKVPHKKTELFLQSRKDYSERRRNNNFKIEIFSDYISLGIFRSSMDIEELTLKTPNTFTKYIVSRFSKPRKGKNVDFLSSFHINQALLYNKEYKGLKFIKIFTAV